MKITKQEAKFKPVTITLETQEELDLFTAVFYNVGGAALDKVYKNQMSVFSCLGAIGGDPLYFDSEGSVILSFKDEE